MKINIDYFARSRRLAMLFTKRKTSSLLDGNFSSRRHGRSMDFDDLREYRYGDEISDIDWKSSSRTGRTLVRRYFAERKHNVLFVCDNGPQMAGDTAGGESKAHLALMTLGVSACLLDKQGVDCALACSGARGSTLTPFMSGAVHLERLLAEYQGALEGGAPVHSLNEVLEAVSAAFSRHMLLVIVTDGEGLVALDERLVRRLVYRNDVYIFKLEDAYLTTPDAFDLQANRFEDAFLTMSAGLRADELALRQGMEQAAERLLTPYRVFFRSIAREEEIVDALAELFRRRREA